MAEDADGSAARKQQLETWGGTKDDMILRAVLVIHVQKGQRAQVLFGGKQLMEMKNYADKHFDKAMALAADMRRSSSTGELDKPAMEVEKGAFLAEHGGDSCSFKP
eukprot:197644-Pyramimonas_sp.AAC.1